MFRLDFALCTEYIGKDAAYWQACDDALAAAWALPGLPDLLNTLERQLLIEKDAPGAGKTLPAIRDAVTAALPEQADLVPPGALAALLPQALEAHRALGSTEAMLHATFGDMLRWANWFERETGRRGLAELHWVVLPYACNLFEIGCLQYQPIPNPHKVYGWAARGGGLLLLAADGVPVNASGRFCTEEEAAFFTCYNQEGSALTGHLIDSATGLVAREASAIDCTALRCVLAPDQPVINLHIPAKANLDPAVVDDSLRAARAFLEQAGFVSGPMVCHSWMLDPQLPAFLPATSRVLHLAGRFARFPTAGEGSGPMFIFGTTQREKAIQPENLRSSLQHRVLAHLQAGGKLYDFGGVLPL